MEGIVNRMFLKCFEDKQFKQAMGIAIEARRMDIFVNSIEKADNREEMLSYAFRVVMNFQRNRSFRGELLRSLIDLYKKASKPDYVRVHHMFSRILNFLFVIVSLGKRRCHFGQNTSYIGIL